MKRLPLDTFERPYFLLCEGEGDKRFFDRLLSKAGLGDLFQVRFPDRGGERTGGRSKFGERLSTLYTSSPSFRRNVKGILVVSDNDLDPSRSFSEVQLQLRRSDGFPIPSREREIARQADYPAVAILMVPIGEPGNLETLCLRAAYDKWPISSAVDEFSGATPAAAWDIGKQAKMKLQTVLAATCEDRPEAGFVGHWYEDERFHVPIDNQCFGQIIDFLVGFPSLVAAP